MQILKYAAYDKYKFFKEKNYTVSLFEDKVDSQSTDNNALRKGAMEDIDRCVARILGQYPFYGEFIYKARFLYDHPDVNTMATDGHNIFVSSKFVANLKDSQIIFVLCHEILHIVFMHHIRMQDHVPHINKQTAEKWNVAADYEINPHLVDNGLITAEDLVNVMHGLYKKEYHELDVETIYDKLGGDSDMPEPPQAPKSMPAQVGDVIRTKKGKQYGVITDIAADGTCTIKDITVEEARKLVNAKIPGF